MTLRHDTSFPYLAIARRFDVPYAQVLAALERFEDLENARQRRWSWPVPERHVADAIYLAWRTEKERRRAVIEGMRG